MSASRSIGRTIGHEAIVHARPENSEATNTRPIPVQMSRSGKRINQKRSSDIQRKRERRESDGYE